MKKTTLERKYKKHTEWVQSSGNEGEQLVLKDKKFTVDLAFNDKIFERASFENCNFSSVDLNNTRFIDCDLINCNLSKAKNISIENFGGSNLIGAKLPASYSFDKLVDGVTDFSNKQKNFTRIYFFSFIFYLVTILTISDRDILFGTFNLSNPFFDIETKVSLLFFLFLGFSIIYCIDQFLRPLTADATNIIKKLPKKFPDGSLISNYITNWAYRWNVERHHDISSYNSNEWVIANYFSFIFSIRFLSILTFLAFITTSGIYYPLIDPEFLNLEPNFRTEGVKLFEIFIEDPIKLSAALIVAAGGMNITNQGFKASFSTRMFFGFWIFFLFLSDYENALIVYAVFFTSNLFQAVPSMGKRMLFCSSLQIAAVFFLASLPAKNINISYEELISKNVNLEKSSRNNLYRLNLYGMYLENMNAIETYMPLTNFSSTNLKNTNFTGSNLSYSNFENAIIDKMNISYANMKGVKGIGRDNVCLTTGYETAKFDFSFVCEEKKQIKAPLGD